jgi:outer membrane receptor protein involved in Fe transport
MRSARLSAVALGLASLYPSAHAADDTPTTPPAPVELQRVDVTTHRLDQVRNQLSTDTGSSVYRFSQKDIEALPMGAATPLNQVLLQAPGTVQDSYGQLHLRGDHANLQYRINGVVIPESISGFGQALDTRLAGRINLLTGALPAEFGYRTAGVVDIQTKAPAEGVGGSISLLGGTQGHREIGGDISGSNEDWSWFLAGSALQSDIGIENPTPGRDALHDRTRQGKAFGLLSRTIDASSRISLMFGSSNNRFQIPNVPGQTPGFTLSGAPAVDSAMLNAQQDEATRFGVLSVQTSPNERTDLQLSVFHRYSDVHYRPDPVGDLVFNGIAASVLRRNEATGLQGDLSIRANDAHTVRAGLVVQHERFTVDNTASVFPADADGNQTSSVPLSIVDNTRLQGRLFGVYLQDEWKPTAALTVNVGARYDHVDTVVREQQFSPRLGLVYELDERTRVHAGYARYFTPPPTEKIDTTSVALFQGTTNALPSNADTAVSSERSHYVDIGLSHQLTPALSLGVDAYYRKVKNLQDEGQFGNALIYSAFNFERARVGGIELTASYHRDGFSGYANVAYSKAQGRDIATGQFNFDPAELAYIASHWVSLDHEQHVSASAGGAYRWGANTLAADVLYGSGLRRGFANTEHLPGYGQVNLSLARHFDSGPLGPFEGRLIVTNLFDRVYEMRDGSGIGVGAPQYGPRRGVLLGLTKQF